MYERNALGYRSSLALCLSKVRGSQAQLLLTTGGKKFWVEKKNTSQFYRQNEENFAWKNCYLLFNSFGRNTISAPFSPGKQLLYLPLLRRESPSKFRTGFNELVIQPNCFLAK